MALLPPSPWAPKHVRFTSEAEFDGLCSDTLGRRYAQSPAAADHEDGGLQYCIKLLHNRRLVVKDELLCHASSGMVDKRIEEGSRGHYPLQRAQSRSESDDENTGLSEGETCCEEEFQVSKVLKSIDEMCALVLRLEQIDTATLADTRKSPQSPEKCLSRFRRHVLWAMGSKTNLHDKLDSAHQLRQPSASDDCDADIEIRLKSKHSDQRLDRWIKKLRESPIPGQVC
jgi:hypothetical protein